MEWFKRGLVAMLLVMTGAAAAAPAPASGQPVGFQQVQVPDGKGGSFPAAIWYPGTGTPKPIALPGQLPMNVAANAPVAGSGLPLVLISHGNGGGPTGHVDLAMALAAAGYVVAAPIHAGDNFLDQGAVGSLNWLADRNRQLRQALDFMLGTWPAHQHIDPQRVGAYGFSAGAFTVLVAAGARPDLGRIATHCARHPEFACQLLARAKSPLLRAGAAVPQPQPDARIRAAVVAAPGLGFTMAGQALAGVKAPVQLWDADKDANVEYATNTGVVRAGLGARAEYHAVAGASHMSFLAPCRGGPPLLCADPAGFDRGAFHARMDAGVVEFFNRTLRPVPAPGGA